jgi:hypothetical protein
MSKIQEYIKKLETLDNWDIFLKTESGLPGPRANLELMQAVAEVGDENLFNQYIYSSKNSNGNSPEDFLVLCGIVGIGKLIADGKTFYIDIIKPFASDKRWRMREGVVMALQKYGDKNMKKLLEEMKKWINGNMFEQRAAIAAISEPRLLKNPLIGNTVIDLIDKVTQSIKKSKSQDSEEFRVLRQGLGYCWSVITAAFPTQGKSAMEKWMQDDDKDIHWIMKENLKKNRLIKIDTKWVKKWEKIMKH